MKTSRINRSLLCLLFVGAMGWALEAQDFYVYNGKEVSRPGAIDAKDIQAEVEEWQIWLYKTGQPPGDPKKRWGLITGKTIESVRRQLDNGQKTEKTTDKFFGKPELVFTYFNPFGPVAVLRKAKIPHPAPPGADRKPATASPTLVERAFDLKGQHIVMNAYAVAADYGVRGVKYKIGQDAAQGGEFSDCSHFANDVLRRSGVNAPYTDTASIGWPHYLIIPADQARPGDIIVRRWFNPTSNTFEGHMGIYTGDMDAKGNWNGVQMGNGGARTGLWGPKGWFTNGWADPQAGYQFYRFKE